MFNRLEHLTMSAAGLNKQANNNPSPFKTVVFGMQKKVKQRALFILSHLPRPFRRALPLFLSTAGPAAVSMSVAPRRCC